VKKYAEEFMQNCEKSQRRCERHQLMTPNKCVTGLMTLCGEDDGRSADQVYNVRGKVMGGSRWWTAGGFGWCQARQNRKLAVGGAWIWGDWVRVRVRVIGADGSKQIRRCASF